MNPCTCGKIHGDHCPTKGTPVFRSMHPLPNPGEEVPYEDPSIAEEEREAEWGGALRETAAARAARQY